MWQQLLNAGIDFVFPPVCCLCQKPIIRQQLSHKLLIEPELCSACLQKIPAPITEGCQQCGAPSGLHVDTTEGCLYCKEEGYVFNGVYAYGVYRSEIKQICIKMKQREHHLLTSFIAKRLFQVAEKSIQLWKPDLIIPVTGYKKFPWQIENTAPVIIAEKLSNLTGIPCKQNIIRKIRQTVKQVDISPTERRTNLKNAYKVSTPAIVKDQIMLLVDDTMTTGSTLQMISQELKQAGAKSIYAIVFSRGLGLNVD